MHLVCQQDELARTLGVVKRAATPKVNIPILACVKLTADDRLRIAGTNLDLWIEAEVPATIIKSGEVCIPARELEQFVHRLPAGEVEIELANTVFIVRSGQIQAKLPKWDAGEFPSLPRPTTSYEITLPAADFLNALKRMLISTLLDDYRPFLKSIYLHVIDGKLAFASTDNNRLSCDTLAIAAPPELSLFLPSSATKEIRAIYDNVEHITIQADEKLLAITGGGIVLVARLYEGAFPAYQHIIPTSFTAEITIARQPFLQSLERAIIIADLVRFSIAPGSLLRITSTADGQEYSDEIPAEITGVNIEIVFSAKDILDWLKVVEADKVHIGFVSPIDQALFTVVDSPYRYIVMPYLQK